MAAADPRNLAITTQDGDLIHGTPLNGLTAIPAGSLYTGVAAQFPGAQISGRILFQTGFVFFREDGTYDQPEGQVIVLWAPKVNGVYIENRQTLIGPSSSEYPDIPYDADSRFVSRAGYRIDYAESGRPRARELAAQDGYDITLYHHFITTLERDLVMNHFLGYASQQFDIDGPSGEVYRVRYQSMPAQVPRPAGRWTVVARLTGYLLVDPATATEGAFPSLEYDISSQFQARAGIIADTAEDGTVRSSRNYGDPVWDLTLIYNNLTSAQRLALLGHFLYYRQETFTFTSHASESYLVQYVERPFGVMNKTDDFTMTVRLVGVKT
ncbi:MAG: hypothetical protein AB7I42_25615 [Bradyrhizobium sp.]|uniref:hypothetical protein n=1 Tax=Bradyrhizobium sp. TaxID=376 RepID=UPI003D0E2BDD